MGPTLRSVDLALIVFLVVAAAIPWMAAEAPGVLMLCIWTVLGLVLLGGLIVLLAEPERQRAAKQAAIRQAQHDAHYK